jgi:hypothetical protein
MAAGWRRAGRPAPRAVRRRRRRPGGEQQDEAAVVGVDDDAAERTQEERGYEAHQPDDAQVERRTRQGVDLPGHRHRDHLQAEDGEDPGAEEAAEVGSAEGADGRRAGGSVQGVVSAG